MHTHICTYTHTHTQAGICGTHVKHTYMYRHIIKDKQYNNLPLGIIHSDWLSNGPGFNCNWLTEQSSFIEAQRTAISIRIRAIKWVRWLRGRFSRGENQNQNPF